jgi:integrase/recombinase XerD
MQEHHHYAASTVSRRVAVLAGFYRTFVIDGVPEHSPAEYVRRPNVPPQSPTLGLSHLQFEAMLTTARLSPNSFDFALVCLLGLLGLRIFEATSLNISDLGEEHGHRVLRVLGKGHKVVLVPRPPAVGRAIDQAIDHRTTGPILLNRRGTRMDRYAATRRLRQLQRSAGVRIRRMHPHMLRHTFVTTMLDAGVDLRDTQIAARHADLRTTMRYDRARNDLDRHPNYILAAAITRAQMMVLGAQRRWRRKRWPRLMAPIMQGLQRRLALNTSRNPRPLTAAMRARAAVRRVRLCRDAVDQSGVCAQARAQVDMRSRSVIEREPLVELQAFSSPGAAETPWVQGRERLAEAELYWLTTVRPDGRPHVTPLIGVWSEGGLYFCTGPAERKAKNLSQNPNCILTTGRNDLDDGLDVVVEGQAVVVTDDSELDRAAGVFEAKYGSRFTAPGGTWFGLGDEIRARGAVLYRVAPSTVFGFGKGTNFSQTRWRFSAG